MRPLLLSQLRTPPIYYPLWPAMAKTALVLSIVFSLSISAAVLSIVYANRPIEVLILIPSVIETNSILLARISAVNRWGVCVSVQADPASRQWQCHLAAITSFSYPAPAVSTSAYRCPFCRKLEDESLSKWSPGTEPIKRTRTENWWHFWQPWHKYDTRRKSGWFETGVSACF